MKNHVQLCISHFFAQQERSLVNPKKSRKNLLAFCRYITQQIAGLEKNYTQEEILEIITPLRKELSKSPLLHRVQTWPRGYQGDFETIEAIIQYKNFAPENTLAYAFEDYFLHSPIAQQHRNKVHQQYEAIIKCIQQDKDAKILSIGCGTSEDIYKAKNEIKKSNARITLLDIDGDALNYSLCKLDTIKTKIHTLQGNIYKLLHQIDEVYNLILIGGVFDYVSEKFIINILKKLFDYNLYNEGEILFTNIANNNPFKIALEYFFDWFLIERSEENIMHILKECGIDLNTICIEKENTNLTYIVHVYKNIKMIKRVKKEVAQYAL